MGKGTSKCIHGALDGLIISSIRWLNYSQVYKILYLLSVFCHRQADYRCSMIEYLTWRLQSMTILNTTRKCENNVYYICSQIYLFTNFCYYNYCLPKNRVAKWTGRWRESEREGEGRERKTTHQAVIITTTLVAQMGTICNLKIEVCLDNSLD